MARNVLAAQIAWVGATSLCALLSLLSVSFSAGGSGVGGGRDITQQPK